MKSVRTTLFLLTALLVPGGFLLMVPMAYRAVLRYRDRTI